MSSASSSFPPAGWYPDPTDPVRHRYWTGRTWGADTRGASEPPSADTRLVLPLELPVFAPTELPTPDSNAPTLKAGSRLGAVEGATSFLRKWFS